MELFFKEKLSLNGKVEITDAEENVLYSGKESFWTGKLIMKDGEGNKLVTIKPGKTIFTRGFYIKQGFKTIGKMKQKISIVNQKFKVKKLDWDVKGDFLASEYTITKGDEVIAEVKKAKLIALLETYSINVTNDEDVANVVAVCLILNRILKSKKKNLANKVLKK